MICLPLSILFDNRRDVCGQPDKNVDGVDITDLESHWKIKRDPSAFSSNLFVDKIELIKKELLLALKDCSSSTSIHFLDCSTHVDSFDLLLELQERLPPTITIHQSTFSSIKLSSSSQSAEEVCTRMMNDLMIGRPVDALGNCKRLECIYLQLGSTTLTIAGNVNATISTLSQSDRTQLFAASLVHKAIAMKYPHCQSPPIIVSCGGHANETIMEAVETLKGEKVILKQLLLRRQNISFFETLLTNNASIFVCVDSFGHAAVFPQSTSPPDHFPSDFELLECISHLCNRGFGKQLCVSMDIQTKLQLTSFGGPGISYMMDTILPALRNALSPEDYENVCGRRLFECLAWHQAPPRVEIAVETLPCYICQKRFAIADDHYSKFTFEYCSSKCLGQHRQMNWKKIES